MSALKSSIGEGTSDRVQNLIVSDIPGPPQQLYFMGGAVSEVFPLMMLSPRHRLRIGAVSLGGRIAFGITADAGGLGDPQGLAEAVEASLDELVRSTRAGNRSASLEG